MSIEEVAAFVEYTLWANTDSEHTVHVSARSVEVVENSALIYVWIDDVPYTLVMNRM